MKSIKQILVDLIKYSEYSSAKEVEERVDRAVEEIQEIKKAEVLGVEEIMNLSSKVCFDCRSYSNRRLCGVDNGDLCKDIATALYAEMIKRIGGK